MDKEIGAHALAASSLQVALLQTLVLRGLLTRDQVRETIETALLQIEAAQGLAQHKEAFEGARYLLESSFNEAGPKKS